MDAGAAGASGSTVRRDGMRTVFHERIELRDHSPLSCASGARRVGVAGPRGGRRADDRGFWTNTTDPATDPNGLEL